MSILRNLLLYGVPIRGDDYALLNIYGGDLKFAMSSVFSESYEDVARTTPASNGSPVQSFQNIGSLGGYVEQPVLANAPTYVASDSNFGNQPTFGFDGGDWYQFAFGETLSQPNTIFVLFKLNETVFSDTIFDGIVSSRRNLFKISAVGEWQLYSGQNIFGSIINQNANSAFCILSTISSSLYINGVLDASGNTGAQTLDGISIASSYLRSLNPAISIVELAVVDGLATPSQINQTLAFFQSVYGVSYTPVT